MSRLNEIAKHIKGVSQPPVHLWKPEQNGSIDIRISAQGLWFHEGAPINRTELVRLFASILWHEEGCHYLVTPVEKLQVEVEDVPYLIHQMEQVDDAWVATTNTMEQCIISKKHPVQLRLYGGQWVPYVLVRYDLWARVNRSTYYRLVSAAIDCQSDASSALLLTSQGYVFEVAKS
jgi:hypothetical protein